jgi:lipopolysaccharide assembly outer membrane protein LptD (OstA)
MLKRALYSRSWFYLIHSFLVAICVCASVHRLSAGSGKPEGEAEKKIPEQKPRDQTVPGFDTDSELVYRLIREGSLEELRDACEERGLRSDGGINELRTRLMQWEMQRSLVPFDEKLEDSGADWVVLNHAEFIRYSEGENGDELIFMTGNVDVLFGGKEVRADQVEINASRRLIAGMGNVRFQAGEALYTGESFFYDEVNDEGYFHESETELGAFIVKGQVIRKIRGEDKYVVEEVVFSTEDIKHPHYWVSGERLYAYDSKKVLVKNASIHYGQDELLRLPYLYRNIRERQFKTSVYFRERSGLVWQNTYTPYRTDERELILKGDFYERLGFYTAATYDVGDSMKVDLSLALSKDVYFYPNQENQTEVTENWTNLGPPGATQYSINRSVRYKEGLYKKFEFGEDVNNTTELSLLLVSDPYYEYDFERRSTGFDFFQFINQAAYDSPTKGSGYAWYLNNYFNAGSFDWYLKNNIRFEPQRNPGQETVSLNDYYQYQIYAIAAPQTGVSYVDTLFEENDSELIADMELDASTDYTYLQYYNPDETVSSRVHQGNGQAGVSKAYEAGNFFRFTPTLIVGGSGQKHLDPTPTQTRSDNEKTLIYGQIIDEWRFGPDDLYLDLTHNLRYKFLGPDDLYVHNRFRIHELTTTGFLRAWYLSDRLSTTYDLRPVYDWDAGSYESFRFDRDRFFPLTNELRFSPFEQLELRDVLVYDIAGSQFKTNQLVFRVESPELEAAKHKLVLSWDLVWQHNFINPFVDELRSVLRIDADIHRYWTFYVRSISLNEEMYHYFRNTAGDGYVNPLLDLLRSFNFFNTNDRKASYFKLKSVSLGFVRDLHEWQLMFDYTGNRTLQPDGSAYFWDQTFSISLGLKKVESVKVHTTLQNRN